MNGRGYVTNDKGGYRAARAAKKTKRQKDKKKKRKKEKKTKRQKDKKTKKQKDKKTKEQKDYSKLDSGQIPHQIYNYQILDSGQISHQLGKPCHTNSAVFFRCDSIF